ncbi:hypothetical protein T484DRAFT_2432371 [Baffinella frigidus]|nr:hypothetical protein T484DRAFT_2432371 [Cryptophyta sp. CCMP2293]
MVRWGGGGGISGETCVAGSFTSSSLVEVEGFSSPSIQSGSVSTLILARLAGCDVVVCRERSLGEGSCSGGRIPGNQRERQAGGLHGTSFLSTSCNSPPDAWAALPGGRAVWRHGAYLDE